MLDVRKYIQIPFKNMGRDENGVDCWGLVCLIYKNELGLAMPDMSKDYSNSYDVNTVNFLIKENVKQSWVLEVKPPYQEWDVLFFRRAASEVHAALYWKPNLMIHTLEKTGTCIDTYTSIHWRNRLTRVCRPINLPKISA